MSKIKIVFVEDDKIQQGIFIDSIDVYKEKYKCEIDYKIVEDVEKAIEIIDGTFDGAILDLKLGGEDDGGNQIADKVVSAFLRVPVIFVTGFPDLVSDNPIIIKTRARADGTYEEDLNIFFEIYHTGLTRIMGGRGKIEQTLNEVFLKNLLPQLEAWKAYGKSDPSRTEKALLRFTLNHLVQVLDDDEDQCFQEEVYIYPPLLDGLKTGSIIKEKDSECLYVVLNPSCDLVVRNNSEYKTDRIMLVELEKSKMIIDAALNGITQKKKKGNKLKNVFGNNYTDYFHWLPETKFFDGGFLNFRKISTHTQENFRDAYHQPHIQISPHFVKDILSRFSSYYARQGQPDIERNKIIEKIIASSGDTG